MILKGWDSLIWAKDGEAICICRHLKLISVSVLQLHIPSTLEPEVKVDLQPQRATQTLKHTRLSSFVRVLRWLSILSRGGQFPHATNKGLFYSILFYRTSQPDHIHQCSEQGRLKDRHRGNAWCVGIEYFFLFFFTVLFLLWTKTEATIAGGYVLISTDCPLLWSQQGTMWCWRQEGRGNMH